MPTRRHDGVGTMRRDVAAGNALITLVALMLFACASPARGQSNAGDAERKTEATVSKKKKKTARASTKNKEEEQKRRRRFWLFSSLSTVFDSNVEHDERR